MGIEMTTTSEFYREQAEACIRAAAEAPLANRRAILLQAQARWEDLAEREVRMQAARARREAASMAEA